MSKIFDTILQTIGETPLVRVNSLNKSRANLFAKVESFNPGGSAKDRVGLAMIEAAESEGILAPGATIIEPTSGNTGIGLALAAAVKGYKLILVMPDTMSIERQKLAAAYGARVELTPGAKGVQGSIERAKELCELIPNSWIPMQFENPANPAIHRATTGPEIWRALDGCVDAVIAGVGTGGTLSGVASYLKEQKPNIHTVAVEPDTSPVLSGGTPGAHKLQGIGAGFIPETYNSSVVDEVIRVSTEEAGQTARESATREGLLIGISGGAAMFAALRICERAEFEDKNVVVILPDNGERYLSTWLFNN